MRRLPPLLWVRIQTDLGPYLVERGLKGGTPVLSWYHRQFREAAEEVWRRFHRHAREVRLALDAFVCEASVLRLS